MGCPDISGDKKRYLDTTRVANLDSGRHKLQWIVGPRRLVKDERYID